MPANGQADHPVVPVAIEDTAGVVAVLCEAFYDYPVMRHVLAGAAGDYAENLSALIGFFVGARVWRGEPMVGIREGDELVAAAIMTPPGDRSAPRELIDQRERLWQRLGEEVRARYEYLGTVWPNVGVEAANLHLNMIGVRRGKAGLGMGRSLLDEIHRMSAADPESTGVSLTTETAGNVSFYRRQGYRLVGHERVTDTLETWGFFRPDETVP